MTNINVLQNLALSLSSDVYQSLAEDSLHRFLLYLSDEVIIITNASDNQFLSLSRKFCLKYLRICYREKQKLDLSLPKQKYKKIKKLLKAPFNILFLYKTVLGVYGDNYKLVIDEL